MTPLERLLLAAANYEEAYSYAVFAEGTGDERQIDRSIVRLGEAAQDYDELTTDIGLPHLPVEVAVMWTTGIAPERMARITFKGCDILAMLGELDRFLEASE